MIRIAIFILAVAVAAAGFAWLADRPGEVTLVWQGYRIETSLLAAGVAVIVLIVAAMAGWTALRVTLGLPSAFSGFLHNRRRAKGYQALSKGMIAIGTGDARAAAKFADQAQKSLAGEPLTLLLRAQTAQLKGDRAAARRSFEAMLEKGETESLGLRGLFVEAQRSGDTRAMRGFAERALALDPATGWAATALFDMQCATRDWAGALATLERNLANRLIDKPASRRRKAVLLTAQALALGEGERARALQLALEAFKLAPDLVPAAALAGRLLSEEGNVRRAARLLEKAWKALPHPDIAAAYVNVRAGDSTRDRLRRARGLAAKMPEAREGAVAVAEAAIDARDWPAARAALAPHVETGASQHVCSLMAEIEEGEHGDTGKARGWLARAVRAPRDPAWTADGVVSDTWEPISPVSGRLDAFEWKVPVEHFGLLAEEVSGAAAGRLEALPAGEPESRAKVEAARPVAAPAPEKAPQEKPAAPAQPAAPAERPSKEEAPAARAAQVERQAEPAPGPAGAAPPRAAPEPAGGKPGEAAVEMPHAPDDPGPGGDLGVDEEVPPRPRAG